MTNTKPTNTNIFPTFTNAKPTNANFLPTTRRSQMVWLATLTAITLIGQYVLLGMTGLGEARSVLPEWFTGFELILWGMRALVEIFVVVYVGMTKTTNEKENRLLWTFEIVLISMIIFTVGPIWARFALQKDIVDIIGYWGVVLWGGGLAGISAMMLAAVAYAFKVQPNDENSVVVMLETYDEMLAQVGQAEVERDKALAQVGQAEAERDKALAEYEKMTEYVDGVRESFAFFSMLPGTALVQVVAQFGECGQDAKRLAEAFGLKGATVRGTLARVNKERAK